jgi:histidine triad (HIT) family protein
MTDYDDRNVFAKILRGDLPAQKVYEDQATIAIMDIMPRSDGHCLVIPKAPSRNILDIAAGDLAKLMAAVQKVAVAAKAAFAADGLTIQHFCEPAGGQVVFHTHVHILPRFDGQPLRPHTGEMAPQETIRAHADKLRRALGAG